jgi:hypothetical protein
MIYARNLLEQQRQTEEVTLSPTISYGYYRYKITLRQARCEEMLAIQLQTAFRHMCAKVRLQLFYGLTRSFGSRCQPYEAGFTKYPCRFR